jgi:proteasome accessory factor A
LYDPQDWGRKFLATNGGCAYIDLGHLELCVPEVLSARDHVAAWHAMLRTARQALATASARLPAGEKIVALVNNSDGLSHSYGSHLNFLITRQAWERLFHRKLHQLLFLAAYQASSIVFTGQGKVGSENGMPPVDFQLSQRADFIEILTGPATTYRRPLVNSRDEPLCGRTAYRRPSSRGPGREMARLHVIFYDSTLCHVASFLKVGVMQIILAMIEAECINPQLTLDDPLAALGRWSHDPTLSTRARSGSGRRLTALELQFLFLQEATRFVDRGGCEGIVPDCREILRLWEDTLLKLRQKDWPALAGRLDWVLKLRVLRQAMERNPEWSWQSPELKHLDQMYGSLDPADGLYWAYERAGLVERIVPEGRIRWLVDNPPENTRAWTRTMLLRRAGEACVDDVDWDRVRIRSHDGNCRTVHLPDPLGHTRASSAGFFRDDVSLDDVADAFEASQENPQP